ncbi:IMP dehydrogenase, partial [Paenibacillus xylanexedens]|uniref:IMP dehydrogenase n=1 Tax=Paenibacillus xylanexedens TaxID=528191 RepID=UPI0016430DE2
TFHHLFLLPPKSHTLPKELHLSLRFSHTLKLNIPLITPPIHTLTQPTFPIPIPPQPGIPIIHKNISLHQQPQQLDPLK